MTDDFASLFAPAGARGSARDLRYRQGVITAWDPLTLSNTVLVDGATLTDLPVLGVAETATYEVGDVVGLLLTTFVGAQTWAIIGRIVRPNTAAALNALQFLSSRIYASSTAADMLLIDATSFTDYVDLGGPTVTANIGPSGRALVMINSTISLERDTVVRQAGVISYKITGASTFTPTISSGADRVIQRMVPQGTAGALQGTVDTGAGVRLREGLTPGDNTFTAMYYAQGAAGTTVSFMDQTLVVIAL